LSAPPRQRTASCTTPLCNTRSACRFVHISPKAQWSQCPQLVTQTARVAMLGNLCNPPEEFASTILTHFRCKRATIQQQLQVSAPYPSWLSSASGSLINAPSAPSSPLGTQTWLQQSHQRHPSRMNHAGPVHPGHGGAHAFHTQQCLGYFHDCYVSFLLGYTSKIAHSVSVQPWPCLGTRLG
jgi:hypothetical protein